MDNSRLPQNMRPVIKQNSNLQPQIPAFTGSDQNRTSNNAGSGVLSLSVTGATATPEVKMQDSAGIVEAIMGTLGGLSFTVDQLPDRAGLDLGGAAQLGINVLRRSLQTFALVSDFIQFTSSSAAQLGTPLKFITGSIFGTTSTDSVIPSQFANNMQFNATLVEIRRNGGFMLAANTAIQITVTNTTVIKVSFMNCGLVPYVQPF